MKEEDKIIKTFGKDSGMTVPDGYFDSFYQNMMDKLPQEPPVAENRPVSVWQRVRPYLYMAAMFAGIWLTMKVFTNVAPSSELSLDNIPQHIAQVMSDSDYEDASMIIPSFMSYELEREISENYTDIKDFEEDFSLGLDEDFSDIDIE